MAKAPQKTTPLPLEQSNDVPEIFVTDVIGAGTIGGCISLNLGVHRWIAGLPGEEAQVARVLVARLVLSKEAAVALTQSLAGLARASQQAPGAAQGAAAAGRVQERPKSN